jgi:hypothetical protein
LKKQYKEDKCTIVISEYEKYSDHHPFMIKVDESSFEIMGEVADLLA